MNNLSHCSMTDFPVDSNGCFSQAIPFAFLLWHRDNTNLNVPDQQIDPRHKKKERAIHSLEITVGAFDHCCTSCQLFLHLQLVKPLSTYPKLNSFTPNKIYTKTQLQCVGYHSTYGCLKSLRKQVCELKKHLR